MSGVEIWAPLETLSIEDLDNGRATWFVCKGDQDHHTHFDSLEEAQECAAKLNAAEDEEVHPNSFDPDETGTLAGAL